VTILFLNEIIIFDVSLLGMNGFISKNSNLQ